MKKVGRKIKKDTVQISGKTKYPEKLVEAIIVQAVRDYSIALTEVVVDERMVSDCERFFRSDWFQMLTDLDGEAIIREIKKQIT